MIDNNPSQLPYFKLHELYDPRIPFQLLFSLLTGLAIWGFSDTQNYGDASHYTSCELEAQGRIRADNRKLQFHEGKTTVIVEDSTSYWCSLGLYTAELKYSFSPRYGTLVFNIILFIAIVIASILLLISIALYNEWLMVPWIALMAIEVIRGLISVFFIFLFSHGNLARIATGIFFLGLQFFHISILMIIIAKFQRMYNRKRGLPVYEVGYGQLSSFIEIYVVNVGDVGYGCVQSGVRTVPRQSSIPITNTSF
uniref:Conserved plasma membrane protein n=1 Tax=Steinernema glaseri TaxID=37863 RepID=A0A1I7XX92_9BILA